MKILVTAATAFIAISSLAWAHGDHEHAAATYGEPGDPAKTSREVVVVMKEADGRMLFAPDAITVTKGEQVRFRLRNEGELAHEFLLGTAAEIDEHADIMKAMPDMMHDDPNAKRVDSMANADLLWHFTSAGEFAFACLIPGHREAGMTGKIVVH